MHTLRKTFTPVAGCSTWKVSIKRTAPFERHSPEYSQYIVHYEKYIILRLAFKTKMSSYRVFFSRICKSRVFPRIRGIGVCNLIITFTMFFKKLIRITTKSTYKITMKLSKKTSRNYDFRNKILDIK
uniref:Uncharacterized protein n=1 Tax=Heterorhabditis bacteriophora TaxID=37862 RepID=A0A1I7WIU3_HETBA